MPDTLVSTLSADFMWDPAYLPSNAQAVGDLHEEIEKLACLFEQQPLPNAPKPPSFTFYNVPPPNFPYPDNTLGDPPKFSEAPATTLLSVIENWKPQTLRETELLLIIDDLQNALAKERAHNDELRRALFQQRQNLDIKQASEKYYRLKAAKLEAQSSSASSRGRRPSVSRSGQTPRVGRYPPALDPVPSLLCHGPATSAEQRIPFSRTMGRRDPSRSVSNSSRGYFDTLSSMPMGPSSNAQASCSSHLTTTVGGDTSLTTFPPIGSGSSASVFSSSLPQHNSGARDLFTAQLTSLLSGTGPSFPPMGGYGDLDLFPPVLKYEPPKMGPLSDSEVPRNLSGEETALQTSSASAASSSNSRRRSSSANRVREVMQSIGFLSARGAPSSSLASPSSTPSHRTSSRQSSTLLPPPTHFSRPISLIGSNRSYHPPDTSRSAQPSSSPPEQLTTTSTCHQNVARAIANERSRQLQSRASPNSGSTDWPAISLGPSATDKRASNQSASNSQYNHSPQKTQSLSSDAGLKSAPPANPLDIDERISSLRQLIRQAKGAPIDDASYSCSY